MVGLFGHYEDSDIVVQLLELLTGGDLYSRVLGAEALSNSIFHPTNLICLYM